MSLMSSVRVARKELLASLRDRQTALYTFVLPLVMYPAVFWVMVQGVLIVQGKRERTETRVVLASAAPQSADRALATELDTFSEGADRVRIDLPVEELDGEAARERVGESGDGETVDAVLWMPEDPEEPAHLFYDSAKSRSELARNRLEDRVPAYADRLRAQTATDLGVDPEELDPIQVIDQGVAPRRDTGALILSSLMPILLIVMAVMGAFFPAVDLVAGEKERKTAETTLLLPIPRSAMLQGKVLAVCATAVVATLLNLLAIGLSAEHLMSMLFAGAGDGLFELPVLALLAIAPFSILFAFMISAVLTGIAGLAATFKEGQAMLGPVQMVFILPAMIGVIPGLALTPGWAFVPVVNVVLTFRSMLRGEELYLEYALCAGAMLLYAWLAIRAAVWLLSREEVLLSGATIPFKRLMSVLRGDGRTR